MAQKSFWNPLEKRTYKFKKVALEFFCPLCRTERAISTHHKLTLINYCQITFLTLLLTGALWSWAGARGLFSFFPLLMGFESVRRMLFSKDVPCPHCGFDASWYKRDVTVAKKLVEDFWAERDNLKTGHESEAASNVSAVTNQQTEDLSQNYFS